MYNPLYESVYVLADGERSSSDILNVFGFSRIVFYLIPEIGNMNHQCVIIIHVAFTVYRLVDLHFGKYLPGRFHEQCHHLVLSGRDGAYFVSLFQGYRFFIKGQITYRND